MKSQGAVDKSRDNETTVSRFKIQTLLLPLTSLETKGKLRNSVLHYLLSKGCDESTYILGNRNRVWYIICSGSIITTPTDCYYNNDD